MNVVVAVVVAFFVCLETQRVVQLMTRRYPLISDWRLAKKSLDQHDKLSKLAVEMLMLILNMEIEIEIELKMEMKLRIEWDWEWE